MACCCVESDAASEMKDVQAITAVTARALQEESVPSTVLVSTAPATLLEPASYSAPALVPAPAPDPLPVPAAPPLQPPPPPTPRPAKAPPAEDALVAGSEIEVSLNTTDYTDRVASLGLALLLVEGSVLAVGIVKEGAAQRWNNENPTRKITPFDRVVKVNGQTDVQEMVTRTKEDPTLTMTLRRPFQFSARIVKKGDALGVRCSHDDTSVMIGEVRDGPFRDWNLANPGKEIKPQDRIYEVNGVSSGSDAILGAMKGSSNLEITILRAT